MAGRVVIAEPELHLIEDVVVPDLAGWHRDRIGDTYRLLATHCGDATARIEPFDAIELELAALWAR